MSSHLPTDMTQSMGLTGLVGQFPGEDYGMGVLNPDILPPKGEVSDDRAGEAGLPDGVVMGGVLSGDGELGIHFSGDSAALSMDDLGEMMREGGLSDLSWLEVDEEDLSRLPKDPHYDAIPELEQEWGEHRGEPGLHFHATFDPDAARYQASLEEPSAKRAAAAPEVMELILRRAMRLSARFADKPFRAVLARLRETIASLPENTDISAMKPALSKLSKEHGLLGRVFIRAAAYPGYEQGEWANEIKRYAKTARYIVVPRHSLTATHNFQGQCGITGKKVVASMPWGQAREVYTPTLQATGRTIDLEGDPKKALLAAFRQKSATIEGPSDFRPVHVAPSQRVSVDEATRALKAHKPERKHVSRKAQLQERERKSAQLQIVKWVQRGLLSKKAGEALVASDKAPAELLRMASAHITRTTGTTASYSGRYNEGMAGGTPEVSEKNARAAMKKNLAARAAAQEAVASDVRERVNGTRQEARKLKGLHGRVAKVATAIDRGVRGDMLRRFIIQTIHRSEVKAASKLLDPLLRKTGALEEKAGRKANHKYSGGSVQREHVQMRTATLTPSPRDLEAYIKWARLTLTEGLCGSEFDTLHQVRWASNIRTAGAEALQVLRDRHEGVSGHLYVDAAAYATASGTKGCVEGSLKNRANAVKFVLAFDRCNGCAFANRRANGTSVCQKYNKNLVTANQIPEEDRRSFQHRMISQANMTDHEATASLFSPVYDPGEYELTASQQIDEATIASAPIEPLQDIWFGGDVELELK